MKGITLNMLDVKISTTDTDGDLLVLEQTGFTPKGGPPLHLHPTQDEIFFVLEGEYLFQVGDEKFQLKESDTIFLPRNVPHAFVQLTEKARMLLTFQPAGKMEAFFKFTSSLNSVPTQTEISKIFELHEMKVV